MLVAVTALLLLLRSGEPVIPVSAGSATAKAAQRLDQSAAARFPVDGPLFAAAQHIAAAHWGTTACNGQVAVGWEPLKPGTNATARWRNPTDAWANSGENFDCSIALNSKADFDFAKLCTVLTHEVGHLLGRPHAEAQGELMSPTYSGPLRACAAARPQEATHTDQAVLPTADVADAAATQGAVKPAKGERTARRTSAKRSMRKARPRIRCVRRLSGSRRSSKRCVRAARQTKRVASRR